MDLKKLFGYENNTATAVFKDSGVTVSSIGTDNKYGNASQCYGFSLFLAKVLFGKHLTYSDVNKSGNKIDLGDGWTLYNSDFDSIKLEPGDIIRNNLGDLNGHSGVVWKIENGIVKFVQCLGRLNSLLDWGEWGGDEGGNQTEQDVKNFAMYIVKAPKTSYGTNVTVTLKTPEVIDTRNAIRGEFYGALPLPSRTGYSFDGWWYSDTNEDQEVSMYTIVTKSTSHDLYAHWRKRYKITNVGANKCLNIYGDNLTVLRENTNVTLWSDSGTKEQIWNVSSCTGYKTIRSSINNAFGLNIYLDGTNNCDVHTISGNRNDASVIIPKMFGKTKIKHAHYDLYLTAVSTAEGANVYWAPSSSSDLQLWTFTEV